MWAVKSNSSSFSDFIQYNQEKAIRVGKPFQINSETTHAEWIELLHITVTVPLQTQTKNI